MPDYILNDSNGLSNSNLALATAGVEDVIAGKTFYAGSKDLKTGTLVKGGKTFSLLCRLECWRIVYERAGYRFDTESIRRRLW